VQGSIEGVLEPMMNDDDKSVKTTPLIPTMVAHMMTPGVVQIPGDVSVSEAAMLLEREQAPCLLIKDTDTQFGIMTPTDIVKKVVAQGLEPHEIEVRTIMTRPNSTNRSGYSVRRTYCSTHQDGARKFPSW